MALPTTGTISLSQVNVELGLSATAQISLNDAAVRTLFDKASGTISMQDGRGKANEFAFTIASNQTNANLRTLAVNAGWNQTSKVIATVDSGIYISSNSTGTPALTINGSFPGNVELINNGLIIGMGGNGGRGANAGESSGFPGSGGGLALSAAVAVSVLNSGTIGGGGGGGGGGGQLQGDFNWAGGGGGGGRSSNAANSSGGAAGTGTFSQRSRDSSPGQPGTVSAPGNGGLGAASPNPSFFAGAGGNGGQWGASGASGAAAVKPGSYPFGGPGGGGGGGGAAVSGNSNITWLATGTRLGAIT